MNGGRLALRHAAVANVLEVVTYNRRDFQGLARFGIRADTQEFSAQALARELLRAVPVRSSGMLCDPQRFDALDFRLDGMSRIPQVHGTLR